MYKPKLKKEWLSKLSAIVCTSVVLSGCVTVPVVSEKEAFVAQESQKQGAEEAAAKAIEFLDEIEVAFASAKWIQPSNKSEECRLWFAWESIPKSIAVNWDGGCKDGFAFGLGREFVKFVDEGGVFDKEDFAYYPGGKSKPIYLASFDNVKNSFYLYAYGGNLQSGVETLLLKDNYKIELQSQARNNEKIPSNGFSYVSATTSINQGFRATAKEVAGSQNATVFRYWDDLYNAGAVFEVNDGAYLITSMSDGTVRHISIENNKDVSLPQSYRAKLADTEQEINGAMNELYSLVDKSKQMVDYYLSEICSEDVKVSFMSNDKYKRPCAENGYFSEFMPAVLKSQQDNLAKRKSEYESWLAQQERARQIAYQQQMAAAANRQANAAEMANFQNSMNAIIDRNNAMINSLNNSTQVQMYQPPMATAPRTYNRIGNMVIGSDGSTCINHGSVITCN